MHLQKRNIVLWSILSILTLGIGSLVWFIVIASDFHRSDETGKCKSFIALYFLTIITFGIYQFFWLYNVSKVLDKSLHEDSFLVLFLLWAFGFGFFGIMYIQSRVNKIVN